MEIERSLGFEPTDREFEKLGYDIESRVPGTGKLRFIEVKGACHGRGRRSPSRRTRSSTRSTSPTTSSSRSSSSSTATSTRVHYLRQPVPARAGLRRDQRQLRLRRFAASCSPMRRAHRERPVDDRQDTQEAHRSRAAARGDQQGLGAGEVDPARAPEHAASLVGAAAAGGGAGGDLRADGGRPVRVRGRASDDPKLRRKAETRSRRAEAVGGGTRSRRRPRDGPRRPGTRPGTDARRDAGRPGAPAAVPHHRGPRAVGEHHQRDGAAGRRATRSGRAGGAPAPRTPTIRARRSCSTATSCPPSTIPSPAAARCRWRRSGSGWRATPATSTRWRC